MDSSEVYRLTGVSRLYGDVAALAGVDLTIHKGEWLSIVGPSGSGKTTLMNILGCMDTASAGTVLLDGEQSIAESSIVIEHLHLHHPGPLLRHPAPDPLPGRGYPFRHHPLLHHAGRLCRGAHGHRPAESPQIPRITPWTSSSE